MRFPSSSGPALVVLAVGPLYPFPGTAADLRFRHHYVNRELPVNARGDGDYGLTALVDIDSDGHPGFVLGGRANQPSEEKSAPLGRPSKSSVGSALRVSPNGRHLVNREGKPFFWLGTRLGCFSR